MEDKGEGGGGWRAWLRKNLAYRRELVSLKIILLLYFTGQSAYLPYLTLHMQTLGITVKEIAVIYTFLPIASLLGPPASGLLADTFGQYKPVMMANMILSVVLHISLLLVPSRPLASTLVFTCDSQGHQLTWSACDLCHPERNHTSLQLTLKGCRFLCETPPLEEDLRICLGGSDQSHCLTLNLTDQITANGTVVSWREEDTCSHTWHDLTYEDQVFQSLTCPSQCPLECQVMGAPPCTHPDDPTNNTLTFWLYFAIRMIATFFLSSGFCMSDATTLALLKEYGGQLGYQRIYCTIGVSLGPLVAGLLVDKFTTDPSLSCDPL